MRMNPLILQLNLSKIHKDFFFNLSKRKPKTSFIFFVQKSNYKIQLNQSFLLRNFKNLFMFLSGRKQTKIQMMLDTV